MMQPFVIQALQQEVHPDDVATLLKSSTELVKLSRDEMVKRYDNWELNDQVYRGIRKIDDEDKSAMKRKGPVKFIMPVTYAQVNTFVSFFLAVVNQNDTLYQLGGSGVEDDAAAKVGEVVLEQNLEHNNFRHQKIKQFATDIAKYGVGILKHSWTTKTKRVARQQTQMSQQPGMTPVQQTQTVVEDAITYQGNIINCVSPFRWFPDPRLPITRFQEGEFCASEDEFTRNQMPMLEARGEAAGTQYIKDIGQEMMEPRRSFSFQNAGTNFVTGSGAARQVVIITEVQRFINPAQTTIGGQALDPSKDYECMFLIWYANDSRVIRIEECNYPHGQFTYDASQYEEDQINFINEGMIDKLSALQDVVDWLINSRITNVRKVIGNQLIVDPKGIELQDLRDRKPVIRLKPAVQGTDVRRWIHQLPLTDVTTNHLQDVEFLNGYAKQTTGITENLLGQFASGRRSAAEARNVNSNATARIMAIVEAIWHSALLPLGRKMLANLQAGLTVPVLVRVYGEQNSATNQAGVAKFKSVQPEDLEGTYDFLVFDGTLPSQRAQQAQVLQELLGMIIAKPETAFIFQYNPQLLMQETLALRGIRNADRFKLDANSAGQLIQLAQVARNFMGAQPAPGGASDGGQPAHKPVASN